MKIMNEYKYKSNKLKTNILEKQSFNTYIRTYI